MEDNNLSLEHKFTMNSRKHASLTGVKDVKSFDEKEIVLSTVKGELIIQGDGLHVKRIAIDKKEAEIEGMIKGFMYSDKEKADDAKSLLARIFR